MYCIACIVSNRCGHVPVDITFSMPKFIWKYMYADSYLRVLCPSSNCPRYNIYVTVRGATLAFSAYVHIPRDSLQTTPHTLYIQTQIPSSIETSPNRNCGRELDISKIASARYPRGGRRLPAAPHTKRRVKPMWAIHAQTQYIATQGT